MKSNTMMDQVNVISERGAIRAVEETLTDGSRVYNVWLDDATAGYRVEWQCADEVDALDLVDALATHQSFEIGPVAAK